MHNTCAEKIIFASAYKINRVSEELTGCTELLQTVHKLYGLSWNFPDPIRQLFRQSNQFTIVCYLFRLCGKKFLTLWKISKLQKKNFKLNGKINLEIRGHFVPGKNLLSWDKIGQFRKLTTQQSCHQLWWPTILSKQFLVKPIIKYLW